MSAWAEPTRFVHQANHPVGWGQKRPPPRPLTSRGLGNAVTVASLVSQVSAHQGPLIARAPPALASPGRRDRQTAVKTHPTERSNTDQGSAAGVPVTRTV